MCIWHAQEQAITVRGGIAWWKDIIIFGCHNHVGEPDEVRILKALCTVSHCVSISGSYVQQMYSAGQSVNVSFD